MTRLWEDWKTLEMIKFNFHISIWKSLWVIIVNFFIKKVLLLKIFGIYWCLAVDLTNGIFQITKYWIVLQMRGWIYVVLKVDMRNWEWILQASVLVFGARYILVSISMKSSQYPWGKCSFFFPHNRKEQIKCFMIYQINV